MEWILFLVVVFVVLKAMEKLIELFISPEDIEATRRIEREAGQRLRRENLEAEIKSRNERIRDLLPPRRSVR